MRVEVRSQRHMTHEEYLACGGQGSGTAHWWLLRVSGSFVRLPYDVRGDQPFEMVLDLQPGSVYVLGVGRSLRQTVVVDAADHESDKPMTTRPEPPLWRRLLARLGVVQT